MREKFINFLRKNQVLLMLFSVTLMITIGGLDHYTNYEVGVSIFYLLPISLVIWISSYAAAFILIGISFFIWIAAALISDQYHLSFFKLFSSVLIRVIILSAGAFYVAKFKELLEKEKKFARTDFLTGLSNSKSFKEMAKFEIERCRRYKSTFSVVYMDCDNFKAINDTFGHQVGDQLLTVVSEVMRKSFRNTDFPSRVGGDEFIILLPETNNEQALIALNRTQDLLLKKMQENDWPITFSFGCVIYEKAPESVDEMIKNADDLMYSAKKNGKNQIKSSIIKME